MRKSIYLLALLMLVCSCDTKVGSLEQWLALPVEERGDIAEYEFSKMPLSKEEAGAAAELLYGDWLEGVRRSNGDMWHNKAISKGRVMRFDYRIFGDKPADGRSLYISLHGGGNAPAATNEQQYMNQIKLYQPEEGVYLAPRAPWDDWDMWFKPGIDVLYDEIIRTAVALEDVNPNKVYLMGYSAGGDGLYRIGPRMADRWAAASMMAGHPGNASQVNLRNLPYMVWMGADDAAYDRNRWAATIGARLDALHAADREGYIHETHIIEGKGHWMDLEDKAAVPWMAQFRRNPYPDKIVWRQEEVTLPAFYWLSVPAAGAQHEMEVRVSRSGNEITIDKNDYLELTIWLNDEMFDLDRPVVVRSGDEVLYDGIVERNIGNIASTLMERGDRNYMFPAKITIKRE